MRHDIEGRGTVSEAYPHLIFQARSPAALASGAPLSPHQLLCAIALAELQDPPWSAAVCGAEAPVPRAQGGLAPGRHLLQRRRLYILQAPRLRQGAGRGGRTPAQGHSAEGGGPALRAAPVPAQARDAGPTGRGDGVGAAALHEHGTLEAGTLIIDLISGLGAREEMLNVER